MFVSKFFLAVSLLLFVDCIVWLSTYLLSLYSHVYLWLKTCWSACLIVYHLSFGCLWFNLSVLPTNTCLAVSFWLSSRWYIRLHILTSLWDLRFIHPCLQLHRKSLARVSAHARAWTCVHLVVSPSHTSPPLCTRFPLLTCCLPRR